MELGTHLADPEAVHDVRGTIQLTCCRFVLVLCSLQP